jgi:hypothetical protein
MVVKIIRRNQSYEFNTVLEVEDMGFIQYGWDEFYWTQFEVALVAAWNAAVVSIKTWKSVIWRCKQSEDNV